MKDFRKIRVVIGLVLCAFIAYGCKSKDSASSANELFVYASLEEDMAQRLLSAFEKDTGVKTQFVRLSTGEAAARLEAEKNNPQASAWLGGVGLGHSEAKQKGLTSPYSSPAGASIPAQYRDAENYWSGIYLGILAFAVNEDQLKKNNLEAPKTWKDLTDPKWKNRIQLPNPGTSGTSYNLMTSLIARDGEEKAFGFLKELHQNVAQYTRSGAAPAKNVALGETIVGVGYAHDILRLIYESKAPLKLIYPADGTGYEVAAISLVKGGKQVESAKKLVDWIYSPSASKIFADHFVVPLKKEGIDLKKEAALPETVKLIDTDIDWAGQNKKRLIELWNEKING